MLRCLDDAENPTGRCIDDVDRGGTPTRGVGISPRRLDSVSAAIATPPARPDKVRTLQLVVSIRRWTQAGVAVVVTLATLLGGLQTGTGLKPARTLGPNVVAGDYRAWWVYFVGPLGGAVLVAALWRLLPLVVLTAKLFHDPRYPSVLRTHLPALAPRAQSRPA